MLSRVDRRRAQVRAEMLATAWGVARELGLGAVTMNEIATRMGMQRPSLYEYVPDRDGLFDAMFAQGWAAFLETAQALEHEQADAHRWFREVLAFCVTDPARFQLLLQRPVPGFEPSAQAYAVAVQTAEVLQRGMASCGVTRQEDQDLVDSLLLGLASNHVANDPGGSRYLRLADRAVDMLLGQLRGAS